MAFRTPDAHPPLLAALAVLVLRSQTAGAAALGVLTVGSGSHRQAR